FVPPPAPANSTRLIETGRMPVPLSPPRQSKPAPSRKPGSFRRARVDCQTRAEAMRRQAVSAGKVVQSVFHPPPNTTLQLLRQLRQPRVPRAQGVRGQVRGAAVERKICPAAAKRRYA